MDEQQNQTTSETGPDDSEPTPERQAELRRLYEKNLSVGKPPYAGVVIRSRGELNWIVTERGWQWDEAVTYEQYIDLRNAGFAEGNFQAVNLSFSDLRRAQFGGLGHKVSLKDADLSFADLSGAVFGSQDLRVDLRDANLAGANLSGAIISGDLRNASLSGANLSGTILVGDFRKISFTRARMDGSTLIGASAADTVQLDSATRLLDVSWNGAILALVNWDEVPRLGEEEDITEASTRKERIGAYRDTVRAYYGLAKALEAQGLNAPALRYRRRQHQLERAAQLRSFNLLGWAFSSALNIVSGYGDRPLRALGVYLAVILAFAGIYFGITTPGSPIFFSGSQPLQLHEAVVFSLSSFHGRGFFPSTIGLGDPVAIVAALEAVVGLFIELVLIATFTRRLFER